MSTVTTLCNAFQTINAGISGIAAAPQVDAYPANLTPDKLPFAITLPGAAVWPAAGAGRLGGGRKCVRTYHVRVYVAPASSEDVGTVMAAAAALIEAVGTTYQTKKTVGAATLMFGPGTGLEDLGFLRTIAYGGAQFFAFETRVPVTEPSA